MYLLMYRRDDAPSIHFFKDKNALLRYLNDEDGDNPIDSCRPITNYKQVEAFESFPAFTYLLIKGDSVQVTPRQVVQAWDVD